MKIDEIYFFAENQFYSQIYDAQRNSSRPPLGLVIANGGAGQIGYIEFLAKNFLLATKLNISIGWIASNTVDTLRNVQIGRADVGISYDAEREIELFNSGTAKNVLFHCWMDRFMIVGPVSNFAELDPSDKVETALLKIMRTPDCFWLSRCDDSTIHHRESEWIFRTVSKLRSRCGLPPRTKKSLLGQLIAEGDFLMALYMPAISPISLKSARENLAVFSSQILQDRSSTGYPEFITACRLGFLHRHCYMPLEATKFAEKERYYTLSDKGILLSLKNNANLKAYIDGSQNDQMDLFYNPADCLLAAKSQFQINAEIFFNWLKSAGKDLPCKFTGRNCDNESCLFAVPDDRYQPNAGESWKEFLRSRKKLQDPGNFFTT